MNKRELQDGELYHFTLAFLRNRNRVWLAFKPESSKIAANCWNGYGGKYEPEKDCSLERTVFREVREEAGVEINFVHTKKVAVIDFDTQTQSNGIATCRVHTYLVWEWDGVPQHTATMHTPTNFLVNDACTLEKIMPADRIWWPKVLIQEKLIRGFVSLAKDQKTYFGEPDFQTVCCLDPALEP
jgi:ADP-ribose pyrophosphatase YjhB (NUDIX family)